MTPQTIIAELGGPGDLAEALAPFAPGKQLVPNTLVHWGRRGIPARYWLPLSRRAVELGKPHITVEVIERASLSAPEQAVAA